MTLLKIPVNAPFWSNAEDESKQAIVSYQRRDVMKDALGSTIRRPALIEFQTGLAGPAIGQYYWENKDLVYISAGKNLYSLSENGSLNLISANQYGDGKHMTWAESGNFELVTAGATRKLFSANGDRIAVYDGSTVSKLNGANAPVRSSHIINFDSYTLSNELNEERYDESVLFSEVADPINFQGEFFSAENKPDPIVAIHSEFDEIAMFGTKSMENFYNNNIDPFVAIPGGNVKQGTLSPWTIKALGESWLMLNRKKRLVRIDGRIGQEVSQAIDDILRDSPDITNAYSDIIETKDKRLYLLHINGRALVYDYDLNEWVGEWGSWNKTTATYKDFKARNFLFVEPWNMILCTDKTQGIIYKLDFDSYRDDGDEIRSSIITGWYGHGTTRGKRVNELKLRIKRGTVDKTTKTQVEPKMLVRWADDGSEVFSNWRDVFLGFKGDTEFNYSLYQMGSYDHDRRYEFLCTDNTPFSIVQAEEDVELLR